LLGKVAIVTGATSGIGKAIAIAFAAEGAQVVASGRNPERGREVVDQINTDGGKCIFVRASLERLPQSDEVVKRAISEYGRVDILVNAAGVFPLGPALEVTEELYDQAFDVNVKGTFFMGQAVLKHMVAQGSGRVINFASVASLIGFGGASLYCATKGALLTLTKAWAVEYAPFGVLVNAIAPGNIETPMNDHLMADPDYKALMLANTPVGRNGQVDDIAPMTVLLASDEGRFFCGSTIVIDGGWVAR
jgi:NAD(P)-dependent dehydrogenase (short-subunit alcohol dehydrogenase family)